MTSLISFYSVIAMEKKKLVIVLTLFTLGFCVFTYFIFFHLKINPYISLVAIVIVALLVVLATKKEKISENYRSILKETFIVLGLSVSYANSFVCNSVFKLGMAAVLAISIVVSLLAGALLLNLSRAIIYVFFSVFVGAIIAVLTILSPLLWIGDYALFNYALLPTLNSLAPSFILTLIISMFGVMLGEFLQESSL